MSQSEDTYLSYDLRDYDVVGEPLRLDSFVLNKAQKPGTRAKLIYKSRANLIHNTTLLDQMLGYREAIADAINPTVHLQPDIYPPKEGEPNLFIVEDPGRGRSIAEIIGKEKLPLDTVFRFIDQLLEGLGIFHRNGLVYGAIDPRFVFVIDARGKWDIRLGGLFHLHKAGDAFPIGYNPEFTAPDLMDANDISDETKDVYSVGMLAYRMLLSQSDYETLFPNAFSASTATDRSNAWQQYHREKYTEDTAFTVLHEVDSSIPPSISAVVQRMLNLANENRFADASEAKVAWRQAIVEANEYIRQRDMARGEGMRPGRKDRSDPPRVTVGTQRRRIGIYVLAASLAVTAIGAVAFYQFVHLPEKARQAEFAEAVQDYEAESQSLLAARAAAVDAVGRLDPAGEPAGLMETAESQLEALRQAPTFSTAEGLNAHTAEITETIQLYREVQEAVRVRGAEAQAAIDGAVDKLIVLGEASAEGDEIVSQLDQELDQARIAIEEGRFDDAARIATDLAGTIEQETAARGSERERAAAELRVLEDELALLETLLPADVQLRPVTEAAAAAQLAFDKRRYLDAEASASDAIAATRAGADERRVLRDEANALLSELEAGVQSLRARIMALSGADTYLEQLAPVEEALATSAKAIDRKAFDDATAQLRQAGERAATLSGEVAQVGRTAEQSITVLDDALVRLAAALPEGVAPDPSLTETLDQTRDLLEAGDLTQAARLAETAIQAIEDELAAIAERRSTARAHADTAHEEIASLAASGPSFEGLGPLSDAVRQADAAFDRRDYMAAIEEYGRVASQIDEARETLDTGRVEAAFAAETMLTELRALDEGGLDEQTAIAIGDVIGQAQALLGQGDLVGARDLLADGRAQLEEARAQLKELAERFDELWAGTTELADRWQAMRYPPRESTSLDVLADARQAAERQSLNGEMAGAVEALQSASETFEEQLLAAEDVSEDLVARVGRAESSRALAQEAGGAEIERFGEAEAAFQAAQRQLAEGQYEDATASLDAAVDRFRTALATVAELDAQLDQIKAEIADRLAVADTVLAMDDEGRKAITTRIEDADELASGRLDAYSDILSDINAAIGLVEDARPTVEKARVALDEVLAELEQFDGIASDARYQSITAARGDADELFQQGAYLAALPVFEQANADATALADELTQPPAMSCELNGLVESMRQVSSGEYPVSRFLEPPRARLAFADHYSNPDANLSIERQFCIQSAPVTYSQFSRFVADLDPVSLQQMPASLREAADPEAFVTGVSRDFAEQYAQWISRQTERQVRLPTLTELMVADGFSGEEDLDGPFGERVWTADNCTTFMAVVAKIPADLNRADVACRLVISNAYEDVYLRLVLVEAEN